MLQSSELLDTIDDNTAKKIMTTIALAVGMLMFSVVVWLRIDAWAQQQRAEVTWAATESNWQDHLYRQAVREVLDER